MGGSAFSPELHTPRMAPAVYTHVRDAIHGLLLNHFAHVSTPIEAPAKPDYGDVDVFVYAPLVSTPDTPLDAARIAQLLNAKAWKRDRGSDDLHLALPWPAEFASSSNPVSADAGVAEEEVDDGNTGHLATLTLSSPSPPSPRDRFIQVDLHICATQASHARELFRCAHGDFWVIVGSVVRRYALSFRNAGLYVRIAELERLGRKMSLVRLSEEPTDVLRFLFTEGGEERFWRRDAFADLEGMCEFIRRSCRFYRPLRERDIVQGGDEEIEIEIELEKREKGRFDKRGGFRYWIEEYVPKHSPADREMGLKGEYAGMTREEVANMVKERFGITKEYDEKQRSGLRRIAVEKLWADVRAPNLSPESVGGHGPEGSFVARTLRRRLSLDARDMKDEELDEAQRAYRAGRFEEVREWMVNNWKDVAERKKAENEEKSRMHYKEMMERRQRERLEAESRARGAIAAGCEEGAGIVAED